MLKFRALGLGFRRLDFALSALGLGCWVFCEGYL